MKIKQHSVPPTYNATERRIRSLAKYISDNLQAIQAQRQAQGLHLRIHPDMIRNILEGFVDPHR